MRQILRRFTGFRYHWDALSGVRSPHLICQVAKLVASHRDSIVPSADTANVKERLHANDRSRPPRHRAALWRAGRANLGKAQQQSTPSNSFLSVLRATMVQNHLLRGVLLAAGLHCARGNAHEPTRVPTTTQAAAPTPRPTMTDRRGGKADEIPVRAAAFAAAGFAALGLIAAAVWWGDGVQRKTPETPRLRPWFGLKARGAARVWTPRLAQPRAPRGRLLPF